MFEKFRGLICMKKLLESKVLLSGNFSIQIYFAILLISSCFVHFWYLGHATPNCKGPIRVYTSRRLILYTKMCNNHTHPKEGQWKFLGGEGLSQKPIFFKGKYD